MTVAATNNKDIYSANGSQIYWDITFPFLTDDGSDIEVYITHTAEDGADTLLDSNYEVDVDNSRVVYPTIVSGLPALASGWDITIRRAEPLTQQTNLRPQGAFSAANIERALDKLTMITQQLNEGLSRCVQYPVSQDPDSTDTTEFLNTILGYRNDAQTAATTATSAVSSTAASAAAASASASAASSSASAASTSAGAASTSASAAASSASAASTSATTASTQATNAASSASAASTSATTASTQATNASSSASAASASASAASSSASAASVSAAAAAQSAIDAATAAAGVLANPMTTAGDMIYGLALGVPERLAKNASANTVLHSGTVPSWSAVVEADITLADNTTNDVSTSKHGLVPKAPNDTTKFLRGDATWSVVSSAGRILQVDYFTASGTWTKPSGCTQALVFVVGGGGGGAGGTTSYMPGGGGGGMCQRLITSGLGSTETVTVGAGAAGALGSGSRIPDYDGGVSSFGTHAVASGGESGTKWDQSRGGAGGVGTPTTAISFNDQGTSDYITVPDHADFAFGSGDYTIEFFMQTAVPTGNDWLLFSHASDASNHSRLAYFYSTGAFQWDIMSGGSWIVNTSLVAAVLFQPRKWYHVALAKYGNDYAVYVEGAVVSSVTDTSAYPNFTGVVSIGGSATITGKPFYGKLKNYRVSNIARYTGAFTPPTAAFSSDANTLLLLLGDEAAGSTTFIDSSGSARTVTTAGSTKTRYVETPYAHSTDRLNLRGQDGSNYGAAGTTMGGGGASAGGFGMGGVSVQNSYSSQGFPGTGYGGGGSGAHGDGYTGGDGSDGVVVVYSIA